MFSWRSMLKTSFLTVWISRSILTGYRPTDAIIKILHTSPLESYFPMTHKSIIHGLTPTTRHPRRFTRISPFGLARTTIIPTFMPLAFQIWTTANAPIIAQLHHGPQNSSKDSTPNWLLLDLNCPCKQPSFNKLISLSHTIYRYVQPMQQTLNDLAQRVLYDESLTQTIFPKVPVTFIGATRTNWQCAWGYLKTKERYEEEVAKGRKVRTMRFFVIEGGNHFVRIVQP